MKTALIVDDNQYVLNVLKIMLQPSGFSCVEAESGLEAVDVLKHQSVDLIITDLYMPEMSEFQLIDWAQDHCPETPIAVVSAGIAEKLSAEQEESLLKAAAVIEKPFRAADLLNTIRPLV